MTSALTIIDKKLNREIINMDALSKDVRDEVNLYYKKVGDAMQAFGHAGLKVGEVLFEVREHLKPKGIWVAFLNRIPGMSARTADRFINRFEIAKENLPAPVLHAAIAAGVDLAGVEKDKPFGKFTDAVRKVGKPPQLSGRAAHDSVAAMEWLSKVTAEQATRWRETHPPKKRSPVVRAVEFLVDAAKKHSPNTDEQVQFVRDVLEGVLKQLKYSDTLSVRAIGKSKAA